MEDIDEEKKKKSTLPEGATAILKAWLLSPEHFTHPYPTPQDQIMLMQKTGIDEKQLKNWFTNARRRIWKPMLQKQLEQGTLTATAGAGGGMVVMPPGVPGGAAAAATAAAAAAATASMSQYSQLPQGLGEQGMVQSTSIGSLPSIGRSADSHAVLMELFARDQELVRQASLQCRRLPLPPPPPSPPPAATAPTSAGPTAMGDAGNGLSEVTGPSATATGGDQDGIGDTREEQSGGQGSPSQHPMVASSSSDSGGSVTLDNVGTITTASADAALESSVEDRPLTLDGSP